MADNQLSARVDVFAFGSFRFDAQCKLLYCGMEEIALPLRAAAILEHFLRNPGRLLSKDELLEAGWQDTIVAEDSLTHAICVIRQALEEDAKHPEYVETLPRRGYRFIAELAHSHQPARTGTPYLVGRQVANYVILERIGVGGLGEVYLANNLNLDSPVAIKAIRSGIETAPTHAERLRREARIAASIEHPYVCQVYDLLDFEGQSLLVMEYIDGVTLAHRLMDGPLHLPEALRVAREVAEALSVAHEKRLVHRDIKPENIMLTRHEHTKVMDFGIAKPLRQVWEQDQTALTAEAVLIGTPWYMSPEQATGEEIDGRSDIFAYGIVMYQCLSGQLPFHGESASEYLRNLIANRRAPSARDIPRPFQQLIDRCLAAQREDRYASFDEIRQELSDPVLFPWTESGQTNQGIVRRHQWIPKLGWVGGATLAAAAAALLVVWALMSTPAPDEPIVQTALLTSPFAEFEGRISPSNRTVAFVSDRGNSERIWLSSIQGGEARPVTPPRAEAKDPTWSPDGQEVAYLYREGDETFLQIIESWGGATRDPVALGLAWSDVGLIRWLQGGIYLSVGDVGAASLWRFAPDGPRLEKITEAEGLPKIRHSEAVAMDVSSDESKVTFVAVVDEREELWISDLDGSGAELLLSSEDRILNPRWRNKDERSVLYISNEHGQYDVWDIDIATRQPRQLTSSPLHEGAIDVSADGSLLVADISAEESHLWVYDPATERHSQLTNDTLSDYWATAARAGETVVFHRSRPVSELGFDPHDTQLLYATEPAALTDEVVTWVTDGRSARLSSDGSLLAYLVEEEDDPRLFVRDLMAGGEPIRVEDVLWEPPYMKIDWDSRWINLAWSPDGATLAYVSKDDEGVVQISMLRVPGAPSPTRGRVAVRADNRGRGLDSAGIGDLHFSPDGTRLAFIEGFRVPNRGGDVQVLSLESGEKRSVYSTGGGHELHLRGWVDSDSLLILDSRRQGNGGTIGDFVVADGRRAPRVIQTVEGVYGGNVSLDPRAGRAYLTANQEGVENIFALDVAEGSLIQLTDNPFSGITFFGHQPMADGRLLYCRQETTYDVWVMGVRGTPQGGAQEEEL